MYGFLLLQNKIMAAALKEVVSTYQNLILEWNKQMYYRKPSNNFVDGLSFYSPNKFSLLTRADTQFRIFQPKIPQTFYLGL